jgi:hypothetical protein
MFAGDDVFARNRRALEKSGNPQIKSVGMGGVTVLH